MRDLSPGPIASRYAVVALKASTSRKSSASAPGTTPACHVRPPSAVRRKVPLSPLAQATRQPPHRATSLLQPTNPKSPSLVLLASAALRLLGAIATHRLARPESGS